MRSITGKPAFGKEGVYSDANVACCSYTGGSLAGATVRT